MRRLIALVIIVASSLTAFAGSITINNSTTLTLTFDYMRFSSIPSPGSTSFLLAPTTGSIPAGTTFYPGPSAMISSYGGPLTSLSPTTDFLNDFVIKWSGGACGIGIGFDLMNPPGSMHRSATCGGSTVNIDYHVIGANKDIIIDIY